MNEHVPPPRREGAAERARQLWEAKPRIKAKQIVSVLALEGYEVPPTATVAIWLKGWRAEIEAGKPDETIPGQLAGYAEIVADAHIALKECELEQVKDTFHRLLATADAIGQKILSDLPSVKVERAADVMALTAAMGQLANAASSVQVSASKIEERRAGKATTIGHGAGYGGVNDELVPPSAGPLTKALSIFDQVVSGGAN